MSGFQHVIHPDASDLQLEFPTSISRELRKKSKTDQKFLQAVDQMRQCRKVAKKDAKDIYMYIIYIYILYIYILCSKHGAAGGTFFGILKIAYI